MTSVDAFLCLKMDKWLKTGTPGEWQIAFKLYKLNQKLQVLQSSLTIIAEQQQTMEPQQKC